MTKFFIAGIAGDGQRIEKAYRELREHSHSVVGSPARSRRIFKLSCRFDGRDREIEVGRPAAPRKRCRGCDPRSWPRRCICRAYGRRWCGRCGARRWSRVLRNGVLIATPGLDDDAIRALVIRLARPHGSGGEVIERAAILAEGADSAAVIAWITAHAGVPEAIVDSAPRHRLARRAPG